LRFTQTLTGVWIPPASKFYTIILFRTDPGFAFISALTTVAALPLLDLLDKLEQMAKHPLPGYPVLPPIGDLRLARLADLQPYAKAITCRFIVLRQTDEPKVVKEGGAV
jgi:hypothetical protein